MPLEARACTTVSSIFTRQRGQSRIRRGDGVSRPREPVIVQLYIEPLPRLRLAAQGAAWRNRRRSTAAHRDLLRSAAVLVPAARRRGRHRFPLHAVTQRPTEMYDSWPGRMPGWGSSRNNRSSSAGARRRTRPAPRRLGLDDQPSRPRPGTDPADGRGQPGHLSTPNAIGKHAGAWYLGVKAPEGDQGIPPNHLIDVRRTNGQRGLSLREPPTG